MFVAARIFYAGVVANSNSNIERLVAVRLEPHGRLVVMGSEPKDLQVRLDNIAYMPLMKAQTPARNCAPYCFPTGELGQDALGVAGCVKVSACYALFHVHFTRASVAVLPAHTRCAETRLFKNT